METKSRYEVIAELEEKKRTLIKERDSLGDVAAQKAKAIRDLERQRADTITVIERKLEDMKEEHDFFLKTIEERKATLAELIRSVDESLSRLGAMSSGKS